MSMKNGVMKIFNLDSDEEDVSTGVNSDSDVEFVPSKKAKKSPAKAKKSPTKPKAATKATNPKDGGADAGAKKPRKPRGPNKPKKDGTGVANGKENGVAAAAKDKDNVDACHADPFNVFEDVNKATDGGKKRISIERIYQRKTQLEHILLRPDTYIGSVETVTQPMWIYDDESSRMVFKEITFVPGLYKIFDEIIVNAADNKQRDSKMSTIKIDINPDKNEIRVWNNGKGIPVVEHQVEKMYVPEMIFGTLLTSSNYDDSERKVTGGRNGYGAKLCNIFSTKFTVETSCKEYRKRFKQTWTENMQKTEKCTTTTASEDDFTCITFTPDLAKFKMDKLDNDIISLMKRRAYDLAGTSNGVRVMLNGIRLPIKSFKEYVDVYVKDRKDDSGEPLKVVYDNVGDRWQIAVTVSVDKGFQQVSFVNSIATTKGGRHVDYVADQIVEKTIEQVKKQIKKTGMTIRPFQIKNHMWVFVNCLIENPTFDSQTKENMTLQSKSFGSKCLMTEKFLGQVMKCGLVDSVMQWIQFKQLAQLNTKCHSSKHSKLKGIPKLEDANDAGTKKSTSCTLILTEGDSAKSLAVSGLGIVGRDHYGVFPLRGKVLNVREATHKQIMENHEINSLLKILGLQYKKKYDTHEDLQSLRYGKVMIMADQDQDGSHIKGLVINFIHHNWPSLIRQNFVEEFITPIVKVTKGQQERSFFSMPEYEEWKQNTPTWNTWRIKYYKGLGTSTSKEAKEYFSDMQRHRIRFKYGGENDDTAIELAFSKKKADERKEWLTTFMLDRKQRRVDGMPDVYLYEKETTTVSYRDFINKELVLFSNMDNERSIPNLVDGLKPGQRKVLFTCFKRNDKREVKVAQLAGSVAEKSAYHHGEASLMSTIINLAQNYVGSNNLNVLLPIGQFGTRLMGGKDAASPRYIFTMLSPVTRTLFKEADEHCLKYLQDDNKRIEPEWYCPIIPMSLVNGAEGIGTGWATSIPNYNPRDLVKNIYRMINHEDPLPMNPWYKGFKGELQQLGAQRYVCSGEIAVIDDQTVEITELPVGTWTQNYKQSVLEVMLTGTDKIPALIQDFKEYHTDTTVRFVVKMTEQQLANAERSGLHNVFKLQSAIGLNNIVLFDAEGCLRKYDRVEDILKEFYNVRLTLYEKRKAYLEGWLQAQASSLSNQARFIMEKINFVLKLENQKKKAIVDQLVKGKYDPDPLKAWKNARKKYEEGQDDEEEEQNDDEATDAEKDKSTVDPRMDDYTYLLSMAMIKMSEEEKDKLLRERDAKIAELNTLKSKTVRDLWREDLAEFETALVLHEKKELEETNSMKALNKKNAAAAGGGGKARTAAKLKFTAAETVATAGARRIDPRIDDNMKQRFEKADKAKENKVAGIVTKRGKKAKGEENNDGADDLENSPLFERVSKKRPAVANLKKTKPVADDKGIKRFTVGEKRKRDESDDDDVSIIEENDDVKEEEIVDLFDNPSPTPPKKSKKLAVVKSDSEEESSSKTTSNKMFDDEDEITPPKRTTTKKEDDGDATPPPPKRTARKIYVEESDEEDNAPKNLFKDDDDEVEDFSEPSSSGSEFEPSSPKNKAKKAGAAKKKD